MNINKDTSIAVAKALAILIVECGILFGLDIDLTNMTDMLCGIASLVAMGVAIWDNFNFTKAAQAGQKVTNQIKAEAAEAKKAA